MRAHRLDSAEPGTEPDHRFSLANERTYLAWVRTAIAIMAGAVGLLKLGPGGDVAGLRRVLASALAVLGVVVAATAYLQWQRAQLAMRTGAPMPRSPLLLVLAVGLTVIGAGVVVLVVAG